MPPDGLLRQIIMPPTHNLLRDTLHMLLTQQRSRHMTITISPTTHHTLQESYSNSPYASQYQHARPSDVFGPSSYALDPALQRSAAYNGPESSFGLHGTDSASATVSPHFFQYNMASVQPPINRGVPNSAFQRPPSDFRQQPQDHTAIYFSNTTSDNLQNTESSTRYSVLPNAFSNHASTQNLKRFGEGDDSSTASAPRALQDKAVSGQDTLRITHSELYAKIALPVPGSRMHPM